MELIIPFQEVTRPGHLARTMMTLGVALLFAAIYLLGGRAHRWLGPRGHRHFLSIAAGISVSYTFVHILPALRQIGEFHNQTQSDYFQRLFPEYSVYLMAMAGFLLFYGLEHLAARQAPVTQAATHHAGAAPAQSWVHIGGFALYSSLITFLSVRTGKNFTAMSLFAVAMGMHIAPIANRLRSEYPVIYKYHGATVLALACIAGWACGMTLNIPIRLVLDLAAIVAGGVIVNAAIAELPRERDASFWSFFTGAVAYTALLLTLSHFEKHESGNGVVPDHSEAHLIQRFGTYSGRVLQIPKPEGIYDPTTITIT